MKAKKWIAAGIIAFILVLYFWGEHKRSNTEYKISPDKWTNIRIDPALEGFEFQVLGAVDYLIVVNDSVVHTNSWTNSPQLGEGIYKISFKMLPNQWLSSAPLRFRTFKK